MERREQFALGLRVRGWNELPGLYATRRQVVIFLFNSLRKMTMRAGMIDVTGISLGALVRAAYNPSRPQGPGIFSYTRGDITDEEVSEILERGNADRFLAVSMDYVKGRSCKFRVQRDGERLLIPNRWYDHSDAELRALLERVGLSADLVDKARAEEKAYIDGAISDAVEFLKENGGKFVELDKDRQSGKLLPDRIFDGLVYGGEGGPIIAKWVDDGREYSLASVTPSDFS